MKEHEVHLLRPESVTDYLKRIYDNVGRLDDYQRAVLLERAIHDFDELDEDDFFGTEGWRRMLLGEDD